MDSAACRGRSSLFFPRAVWASETYRAIALCGVCPVIEECAEYADAVNASAGVWAGKYRGRGDL